MALHHIVLLSLVCYGLTEATIHFEEKFGGMAALPCARGLTLLGVTNPFFQFHPDQTKVGIQDGLLQRIKARTLGNSSGRLENSTGTPKKTKV